VYIALYSGVENNSTNSSTFAIDVTPLPTVRGPHLACAVSKKNSGKCLQTGLAHFSYRARMRT
jgi:hypothetical protein